MSTLLATIATAEADGRRLVADAEREHRDAQTLHEALKERVRDGDAGVQPGELGEAAALVEHTGLRIEAAKRQAAQLVVDARHQAYREVGAAAIAFDAADEPPVLDAYRAAVDALGRLIEVTESRSSELRQLAAAAEPLIASANDHQERPLLRAAGIANAGAYGGIGQPASIYVATEAGVHRTADVPAWQAGFAALHAVLEAHAARIGDRPWSGYLQTGHGDLAPLTKDAAATFPEMAPPDRPGVTIKRQP